MTKYILAFLVSVVATPIVAKCNKKAQIETLALNIYHEARGEGLKGMQMVGEVTLNRVSSDKYPNTVCGVVNQRKQFSWTSDGKSDVPKEKGQWNIAVELAENLVNGDIETYDNGATHFLNPNAVKRMPKWTKTFPVVDKVGQHIFYKGV